MATPSLDESSFKPEDFEERGVLAPIAASVAMKTFYCARVKRFDVLFSTCALAREVTRWTRASDKQLHRLVSYLTCIQGHVLETFVGDPPPKISPFCRPVMPILRGTTSQAKALPGGTWP